MDMNSSSTSNTSAPSALHHNNKQQEGAVMVTSPPSPMEEEVAVAAGKNNVAVKGNKKQAWQQAKARAQQEQGLNCPRCDSSNTKFCYYNNYNLSQPRYFCKACRRYWTRGGTLRNVPVGGGTRKNKHHQQSSSTSKKVTLMSTAAMAATTAAAFPNVVLPTTFMSSFELPTSSLPFAPLSLSNPDGGSGSGTTPSFLDILRGGGLFDGSNGMPAALQFLPPPSFGAGAMNGTPLLHGVEEEVKPPTDDVLLMMEHGGFAAAGPAGGAVQQQEQVVAADARSRSRSNNNNNGGGGAPPASTSMDYYWQ